MNKTVSTATDFKRKPYAKPLMTVVEIKGADIICTSTNDPFTPDPYDPWTPQP